MGRLSRIALTAIVLLMPTRAAAQTSTPTITPTPTSCWDAQVVTEGAPRYFWPLSELNAGDDANDRMAVATPMPDAESLARGTPGALAACDSQACIESTGGYYTGTQTLFSATSSHTLYAQLRWSHGQSHMVAGRYGMNGPVGWGMRIVEGKVVCEWANDVPAAFVVTDTAVMNDDEWHHAACIIDKAGGLMSLWRDGVVRSTLAIIGTESSSATVGYLLACRQASVVRCRVPTPYATDVDNVIYWDSAVSVDLLNALYGSAEYCCVATPTATPTVTPTSATGAMLRGGQLRGCKMR